MCSNPSLDSERYLKTERILQPFNLHFVDVRRIQACKIFSARLTHDIISLESEYYLALLTKDFQQVKSIFHKLK